MVRGVQPTRRYRRRGKGARTRRGDEKTGHSKLCPLRLPGGGTHLRQYAAPCVPLWRRVVTTTTTPTQGQHTPQPRWRLLPRRRGAPPTRRRPGVATDGALRKREPLRGVHRGALRKREVSGALRKRKLRLGFRSPRGEGGAPTSPGGRGGGEWGCRVPRTLVARPFHGGVGEGGAAGGGIAADTGLSNGWRHTPGSLCATQRRTNVRIQSGVCGDMQYVRPRNCVCERCRGAD